MRRKQDIAIISGTGRSGTTFLMRIFIFLNMDTGFSLKDIDRIKKNDDNKSNSGLERRLSFNPKLKDYEIIKQPGAYIIPTYVKKINSFYNPTWIVPIRNFEEVSKSRARLGTGMGGFWPNNIKNKDEQLAFNYKMLSDFLNTTTELGIEDKVVYLSFERICADPIYVFNKLKFLLDKYGIGLDDFQMAHKLASNLSKSKSKNLSS